MAKPESCPYCDVVVDRTDKVCPSCNRRLTGRALLDNPPDLVRAAAALEASTPPAERRGPPLLTPAANAITRVAVVDIDMPFGSMVGFMVKWALAAIPAMLILVAVGLALAAVLAFLGALGR